jgi:hypothetical protein
MRHVPLAPLALTPVIMKGTGSVGTISAYTNHHEGN